MSLEPFILGVAIIGAVATVVLLYRDIQKKKRRVIVKVQNFIGREASFEFRSYVIEVINHSRQDVNINSIVATYTNRERDNLSSDLDLPRPIAAGDSYPFHLKDNVAIRPRDGKTFSLVQARGTLGNLYTGKPDRNVEGVLIIPFTS